MTEPTPAEADKLARHTSDPQPTNVEAQLVAEQLAVLADVGRRIEEWQHRLDEIEPATTYRVPREAQHGR
jgi:hypothetical protein